MKSFGCMPAVRTPEASRTLTVSCPGILPSPLRDKVGALSTTIDFGAMSPFTLVPAYTLPVYASQWPLPDTTQDSVHGCWLGFAAVAITGDRIPCAYKAQLSQEPKVC